MGLPIPGPIQSDGPVTVRIGADSGEAKWSLLGRLGRLTPAQLGVDRFMTSPSHPAAHELAYWKQVIETDSLHPQPIAAAAIRWLESNLPDPSGHLTLVHGDYRTGNYLYTPNGDITAVLDWEMAHIGDPLEDLAWSLDPLWSWGERIAVFVKPLSNNETEVEVVSKPVLAPLNFPPDWQNILLDQIEAELRTGR